MSTCDKVSVIRILIWNLKGDVALLESLVAGLSEIDEFMTACCQAAVWQWLTHSASKVTQLIDLQYTVMIAVTQRLNSYAHKES